MNDAMNDFLRAEVDRQAITHLRASAGVALATSAPAHPNANAGAGTAMEPPTKLDMNDFLRASIYTAQGSNTAARLILMK